MPLAKVVPIIVTNPDQREMFEQGFVDAVLSGFDDVVEYDRAVQAQAMAEWRERGSALRRSRSGSLVKWPLL